jgi:hypothetical protein
MTDPEAASKETEQKPSPQASEEVEYPPLFDYLQTKEGHELASRIVALIEALQKATTEAGADQKKREIEFQHSTMRIWMYLQAAAITAIIITAAALAWHGKLDATVATLMATLFGYFLGRPNVR